jgi:hypothetical protein
MAAGLVFFDIPVLCCENGKTRTPEIWQTLFF